MRFGPMLPSLLMLLTALTIPATVHAEPFHDATHKFSVELPTDWSTLPAEMIHKINSEVGARLGNVRYDTGFHPRPNPRKAPSNYPYILVQSQVVPTDGLSYDDIEREFGKALKTEVKKVETQVSDVGRNLKVGEVVIDRNNARIIMRTEIDVINEGKVQGISYGFIGKGKVVFLHCYARAGEFNQQLPEFMKIIDSFKYDPGEEFVPGSSMGFFKNVGNSAVRGGIIGAVVGGLVGLVIWLIRKVRGA